MKSGKLNIRPLNAGRAFGTPCLVGLTGFPEPHFHTDKAVPFSFFRMLVLVCSLFGIINEVKGVSSIGLIPCPDCERKVSRRALMCPYCGCKGEVIEEAARNLPMPIVGDVLECDCDGLRCNALPVEFEGRRFAVLPFDSLLGATRVRLFKKGDAGHEVQWMVPELAEDAPIVRLGLQETNLVYWTIGGDYVFDGKDPGKIENKVNAVVSKLSANTTNEIVGLTWQVLQPKQMRNHGKIVKRILQGESLELPDKTHPYFKKIERKKKGTEP